ncbi:hypothetical protein V502_05173 [Pseudogymnoascus sp. VKM F-4520 (FW-2644)]|nr:hypothetical protein V502_05173 [Pseudogymnoascus sp. VKM F-4520 (FW-2644)]
MEDFRRQDQKTQPSVLVISRHDLHHDTNPATHCPTITIRCTVSRPAAAGALTPFGDTSRETRFGRVSLAPLWIHCSQPPTFAGGRDGGRSAHGETVKRVHLGWTMAPPPVRPQEAGTTPPSAVRLETQPTPSPSPKQPLFYLRFDQKYTLSAINSCSTPPR